MDEELTGCCWAHMICQSFLFDPGEIVFVGSCRSP